MPKPFLIEEDSILERNIIETLIAGLHEWRNDLSYPESYSDMQACVRGLMKMYEIIRRPIAVPLRIKCHFCNGIGDFIKFEGSMKLSETCKECKGYGYLDG